MLNKYTQILIGYFTETYFGEREKMKGKKVRLCCGNSMETYMIQFKIRIAIIVFLLTN